MTSLCGQLLLATPAIEEGPFHRTVVFLLNHDDDGALGVILNRPLPSDVEDILPSWAGSVAAPECLFDGGPVGVDSALGVALVRGDAEPEGWKRMAGKVGLINLDNDPPGGDSFAGVRVFAGYAGWSEGQLEGEIDEGSWIVVPARDDDLLTPVPEGLWHLVMRRQEGDLRFWSTFPEDPGAN